MSIDIYSSSWHGLKSENRKFRNWSIPLSGKRKKKLAKGFWVPPPNRKKFYQIHFRSPNGSKRGCSGIYIIWTENKSSGSLHSQTEMLDLRKARPFWNVENKTGGSMQVCFLFNFAVVETKQKKKHTHTHEASKDFSVWHFWTFFFFFFSVVVCSHRFEPTNVARCFLHVDTCRKPVFRNLSFKVPSSQTFALVGASGSGKTSVIRLLFRLFDIQSGQILIDDQDISKASAAQLSVLRQKGIGFTEFSLVSMELIFFFGKSHAHHCTSLPEYLIAWETLLCQVTQKSLRENLRVVPQDIALFNTNVRQVLWNEKLCPCMQCLKTHTTGELFCSELQVSWHSEHSGRCYFECCQRSCVPDRRWQSHKNPFLRLHRKDSFALFASQIASLCAIIFTLHDRYNISYGQREASDEQIEGAATAADIHKTITALPDGISPFPMQLIYSIPFDPFVVHRTPRFDVRWSVSDRWRTKYVQGSTPFNQAVHEEARD